MSASAEDLAGRLRWGIEQRFDDVKAFQQAIYQTGVKGSSKGSVQAYLDGDTSPSVIFLEAAADLLGVRAEWLALGRGHATEQLERSARYREYEELGDLTSTDVRLAFDDLAVLESWSDDRKGALRRRFHSPLARFSLKVQDAALSAGPWMEGDLRRILMRDALRYLLLQEEFFRTAGEPDPDAEDAFRGDPGVFLRISSSPGFRVVWEDAVLDLLSRRVIGLGERGTEYWDQHAPAAGGPPPIDYAF